MDSTTLFIKNAKYVRTVGTLLKVFVILGLALYVLLTYSRIGLFLWEIAPILSAYLITPVLIGYMAFIKLKQKKKLINKKSILSLSVLIIVVSFCVWSFYPAVMAPQYSKQFDEAFVNSLGKDYESKIPESVLSKLSPTPFSWRKLLFMEVPNKFTVVKNIHYGNHSRQFFDIYYPLNLTGYHPAIIEIHGGATINMTNRAITERLTAAYFTAQGIIVISVEYRIPPEAHYLEMVTDIRMAIKWIRDHADEYHINKSQIFVLGRSRGGQLATTAIYSGMNNNSWYMKNAGNFTSDDLTVAGVISLYGEVNPYMAKKWGNDYVDGLNKIVFGVSRDEAPDLYRNCSAEYLIGPNTPPTFLMHGSLDKAVFSIESRHLTQVLTANDVLNVYLELPTGQHGFDAFPWSPDGQLMYYYLERFIWYVIYAT